MRVLNRGNLPVGLGVRSLPKSIYSMMQQFKGVDFFFFLPKREGKESTLVGDIRIQKREHVSLSSHVCKNYVNGEEVDEV